jgi:hypothetical protein
MICVRCGNEMPHKATICAICGTVVERPKSSPSTSYREPHSQSNFSEPSFYERGYTAQPKAAPPPPQAEYMRSPQQPFGYAPPYTNAAMYPPGAINVTIVNPPPGKKDGALAAEIILSLFGVFGVGWLIGGETAIGIVLLVCSFVLYWPVMILGTLFTFGLGLICLGPLAIGLIILNALLLNNRLNRKATQYVMVQSQQMPMPPPRQ